MVLSENKNNNNKVGMKASALGWMAFNSEMLMQADTWL